MGAEQGFQPLAQGGILAALAVQERGPFRFGQEQRLREEIFPARVG